MAFTRAGKLLITISILVLVLIALRVYGAYQRERDNALEQAAIGDQKANQLNEESERLKQQSDCNLRWLEYENARLKKSIAEMRGTTVRTPLEPTCTGHAARIDESLELMNRQVEASSAVLDAIEYAKYARAYASSRKYQTRYLLIRFWAFLTGTEPKMKPAEMVAKIQRAASLDNCMIKATDDVQRKACEQLFGKPK